MASFRGTLVLAGLAALLPLTAPGVEGGKKSPKKFVVHEWGVQIRSRAIVKTRFAWRNPKEKPPAPKNMLTVPDELVAGLPGFVIRHEKAFTSEVIHRAWDKPVLHFYGGEGLKVSVRVLTPKGRPLVYWPAPELVKETFWTMGSGVTDAVGMKWKGRLTFKRPADVRKVEKAHWWNTVRDVPAMWIKTDGGSERFIFYEATAVQEPPLVGGVDVENLTLANTQKIPSGQVIVIVNDGTTRNFAVLNDIAAGATATLSRKDILSAGGDEEKLLAACRAQWLEFGMTEKEAAAIVETWKPDLLNRVGFLVISRVPPDLYEKMFPLEITPKPDVLVRVGLVFDTLPGEHARLGWLPGLQGAMEKWAKGLAAEDFKTRDAARRQLMSAGDLAAPFLKKLTKSSDEEVRSAATALLKSFEPGVVTLPVHGKGSRPVHVKRH